MATHGSVSAFNPSKEDWISYVLRLKYYFDADGVTEASKEKSILLLQQDKVLIVPKID